jgi:two-component system cell cycle sensor histidine kinase/response regulator CckA
MNVLLVEDNPADARFIQEMLKGAPQGLFDLAHAEELRAALAALRDPAFDVLLLDLGLPDSQGLETLARVQAQIAERLPIIVLTGLNDEALALEALHRGAQDFLAKTGLTA